MENGERKSNSRFLVLLVLLGLVLMLLGALLLWGVPERGTDVPASANTDTVVEAASLASVQSVQSVQSARMILSEQSLHSVQWAAGLTIADIGMLDLADIKARKDLPADWRNILLIGTDSRDMKLVSMLDTIIIVSINKTTGELKLTSILRDTMIPIAGRGMQRINTAAYYGGPSLLMQAINENLGMNITEYVLVNFAGLANVIDALGGIQLDINRDEMAQINSHMGEIAFYTMSGADYLAKRKGMRLSEPGQDVPVNGIQAVSYARIRNIDSDVSRASRQRNVIKRIAQQVMAAGMDKLAQSAPQMWGNFTTNIDMLSAIALMNDVLAAGEIKVVAEHTVPNTTTPVGKDGALIDVDYAAEAAWLHKFIY